MSSLRPSDILPETIRPTLREAHGNTEVDANGDFEITIDIAAPYGSVAFMSQSNGGVFSDVVWEEYGDP